MKQDVYAPVAIKSKKVIFSTKGQNQGHKVISLGAI